MQVAAARGNPRSAVSCFSALLLLALAALRPLPAAAAPEDELIPFTVQVACLDTAGAPIPGRLPFEAGCSRTRPLASGEPLPYRKHDWPAEAQAAGLPFGYQASDSVLGTLLGARAAIQTFDFGGGNRAFGRQDTGDGGQVVLFPGDAAAAAMTEDGGGGVQWFQSPACAPGRPAPGWLFAALPLRESWQERVVQLFITKGPNICPTGFSVSLTRWRTVPRLDLPWRDAASGARGTAVVQALVSEHFGGPSVAAANHLERFWFVRGLGLARWERWENPASSPLPNIAQRAALVSNSRRCPEIALGEPPAPGWQKVDCRHWTNMARANPGAPLPPLAWPEPGLR